MSSQTKQKYSPQEYLAFERASPERHEYYNGEIFAKSGASERHNLITGNALASLHAQMRQDPASSMRATCA